MEIGKKILLMLMAVALVGLTSNVKVASALPLSFANSSSTAVTFTGAAGGTEITFEAGTIGGIATDAIAFTGPSFVLGAVSTIPGGESAPVTGTGTLALSVGSDTISGLFSTGSISHFGAIAGNFNLGGSLNFTGLSCTAGTCATGDLATLLASAVGGIVRMNFIFSSPTTLASLASLTTGATASQSYSGTVNVPEPGILILMGSGLIGLFGVRKKFQQNV